jgi:hypothetical protein
MICSQSVTDAVQSVARSGRIDVRSENSEFAGASYADQVIALTADTGDSVQLLAA